MGSNISSDFDSSSFDIFLKSMPDVKKKQVYDSKLFQKDSITPAGGFQPTSNFVAGAPCLTFGNKKKLSIFSVSSTKFAYQTIQPNLLKIDFLANDLILKIGEPNEKNIGLLELLKKISDAIKALEEKIQEARTVDTKKVKLMLKNIVDNANDLIKKILAYHESMDAYKSELESMKDLLKESFNIKNIFTSIKRGFQNLKSFFNKENRKARRGARKANRKARRSSRRSTRKANRSSRRSTRKANRASRKSTRKANRSSRKATRKANKGQSRSTKRANRKAGRKERRANRSSGKSTRRSNRKAARVERKANRKAGRSERRDLRHAAIGNIFSNVRLAFTGISGGRSVRDIIGNIINLLKTLLNLLFGLQLQLQELRLYSVISLMTISSVYLELSKSTKDVGKIGEEENAMLDEEQQEIQKEDLKLIMANFTADPRFREVCGEENCELLESDEFVNELRSASTTVGEDGEEVSEESLIKFVMALLEENEKYIASLLKDLKMLKKLYDMVLAQINGQVGGDFGKLAKDLQTIVDIGQPETLQTPTQA